MTAAQIGTGRVTGVIRDERGNPIKGATVTAENENFSPRSFTSATDARGRFNVFGLRRAIYRISISAEGFETITLSLPVQSLGPNRPLDLRLLRRPAPAPPPLLANVDAEKLQRDLDAAAALVSAGRTDAAIAAYRRIAEATPSLTSVHLQLGYLYEQKRDRASAIAAYEKALAGDPTNAKAREGLRRAQEK
ncbi:MAG TPA: carboxypeptidase regulatory-like domain-containing protein [Vicinamibacterales bacterium]|nr:carboxypeptidase regulatory-like domain-containing protein [Vicinamibacterales bacterium]